MRHFDTKEQIKLKYFHYQNVRNWIYIQLLRLIFEHLDIYNDESITISCSMFWAKEIVVKGRPLDPL